MKNSITDVPGIEVGHSQDFAALTGVTVLLCRKGAVAGVDQRGGAPGTRETDLLNPVNMIQQVHAICLSGGSAFGLDATSGAMKYLEEQNVGYNVGVTRVPIVPAAVLFDLSIGNSNVRPDAAMGYQAAINASVNEIRTGNVGAGTGATIGKLFGNSGAMKGGIGSASMKIGGGVIVGALVAVNAFGDVIEPETGKIIAGLRSIDIGPVHFGSDGYFANTLEVLKTLPGRFIANLATRSNTVIGVVATNAKFDKAGITKIAQMAQDGLARAIKPAHTMFDGDTIFALSTGSKPADISIVGAYAAEVFQAACLNAVLNAESAGGLPGLKISK